MHTASWVIVDKVTGKALYETFSKALADMVDTTKCDVVPILQYLGALNKSIREG